MIPPADASAADPASAPASPGAATARRGGKGLSRALLLVGLAGVLAAALAGGGLSFVTISDRDRALAEANASLAAESSAHQAAAGRASALAACVASMKADQATLLSFNDDLRSIDRRVSGSGDWETARQAYETMMARALSDFYASWIDTVKGDQVAFKRDYANAQIEWDKLEDLKDKFGEVSVSVASDRSGAAQAFALLEGRLSASEAVCREALDLEAAASASEPPSPAS